MPLEGLSEQQAAALLKQHGRNAMEISDRSRLFKIIWGIVKEPMFLLLSAACLLYFLLGENTEGFMMIAALAFVSAISLYQEVKSSNALQALRQLTTPRVKVLREGVEKEIDRELLVPGDLILLEEGGKVPADAEVIQGNDLSVNESVITGESLPVDKNAQPGSNQLFQGSVINSGRCTARVTATGTQTVLGKIGKSIMGFTETETPLQVQVNVFVKRLAFFGLTAFALIFLINYLQNKDVVTSLLFGLTLAMSAVPEEIPVAFSSFMALGAYHMSRLGIITRQSQTIENLGAVNVICLDKTGTITENKMKVEAVFDFHSDKLLKAGSFTASLPVLFYGLLASEKDPFDAMEKAIVEACEKTGGLYSLPDMLHEYPLEGQPPMMTHVYKIEEKVVAAGKGGIERIIRICGIKGEEASKIMELANAQAAKGHRVLGVASAIHTSTAMPAMQDEFNWQFHGLISLYDPPKALVKKVFNEFYEAGIELKLLTGDFPQTALSIAKETGLRHTEHFITGDEILQATHEELKKIVGKETVFARMQPHAKLKVINALSRQDNIVAMTGDGVNDGPALKAASIGIAMGQRGTEVARQSADLVITDDNLGRLVEAIKQGRKIFSNLKKAVRYIISIHIPIILIASLPLLFGWFYPNIFTPIHVIFLELIMGPTCSIFYEREPVEASIMKMPPRKRKAFLFDRREIWTSVLQGLAIAGGILILYYWLMQNGASLEEVRTHVFTSLVLSNILLTFVNRSFDQTFFTTIRYKNNLALPVFIISAGFLALIHFIPFVRNVFGMSPISLLQFLICLATAFVSVVWFEVYKILKSGSFAGKAIEQRPAFETNKQV